MNQTISDFHKKCKERAEKLAKEMGVEFTPLDVAKIETDTKNRMESYLKYNERKEEYDALLDKVFEVVSPKEVVEFLKKTQK